MKQFLKKNWALVLAFAGPILFIGVLIILTYIPQQIVVTDYDFVYTTADYHSWADQIETDIYVVKDQKINAVPSNNRYNSSILTLWLYDSTNHTSRQLSLEEAKELTVDISKTSPDGVSIHNQGRRRDGFFPFFDSHHYDPYLIFEKDGQETKLNISSYEYEDFLGWVIE